MQKNGRAVLDIDDLVRCEYVGVVRLCRAILSDSGAPDADDDAEDAAQEAFIAAANALESFRGQSSVRTWLFSIAINACRGRLRRRRARRALANTLAAVQRVFGTSELPEQRAERSDRDRRLWAAVDRLDDKHRLVVLLRYVYDMPAGEIAQALGISEGTVHSRLHYARRELLGLMQRGSEWEEVVA